MTGESIKKKRDPIFSACFVVFVVACVGVLGVYVDEHYIEKDATKAAYGNTVTLNYTGTYYAAFGDENAVVFDTTLSSVGKDKDVLKANDFSKSSYSTIDVTIGRGSYLSMFENCLIGHKAGDKIQIVIPAGNEAYPAPEGSFHENVSNAMVFDLIQVMSKTQFDNIYDDISLSGGKSAVFTTIYGWDAMAFYDVTKNIVTITNMPESGKTYEYMANDEEDDDEDAHSFGTIKSTVSNITGTQFTATFSFEDVTFVNGTEIQMLPMNLNGQDVYITNVGSNTFSYKTCEERQGIDLYFEIEIVSVESS